MIRKLFQIARLLIATTVLLWLVCSCSCQQRLARLQRTCPECLAPDTLRLSDTVVPPPIPIVGHLSWFDLNRDTMPILLQGANYSLNITLDDSGLSIDGYATPDTIVTTIEVPATLPATVLAEECYYQTFSQCENLLYPPALPELAVEKYATLTGRQGLRMMTTNMFFGCAAIVADGLLPEWYQWTAMPSAPAATAMKNLHLSTV